jgi:hypothetical protein
MDAKYFTSMPFSSAPLNRKITGCLVGSLPRDSTSNTSRATATLTPLSLAPNRYFLNNQRDLK